MKTRTGFVYPETIIDKKTGKTKNTGRWIARFDYTDRDGHRRKKKRVAPNKSEANLLLRDLLKDFDDNGPRPIETERMSLDNYYDWWLKNCQKQRLAPRTYSDYDEYYGRYVKETPLGKKRLLLIEPEDIQNLYARMQADGLSPRTVRYMHAMLSSAFNQAVKLGRLSKNPCKVVELPKQYRREINVLTPEQAADFLAACSTDKYGLIFHVALNTGLRPEEYLGMQWKDVDLNSGVLSIQRVLCWNRKGGGYYFAEPKTTKSRRSVPLPAPIVRALGEHKKRQAEQRLKVGPKWLNLDLVFCTAEGGPIMPQNLMRRHFKPILKQAGLPESTRMYDLRHACATLLLAAGEHPKVVSERLGHSSIVLTLDTYSHVSMTMQKSASDRLAEMLYSEMKQKSV